MALFNYECDEIKRKIKEVSPNYPQLTTYTSEWLYFYENEYTPGTPVELEYQKVIVNPSASVSNAIPYQYKSAILKGNTDENLQSVIMPVLTTTGKNIAGNLEEGSIGANGEDTNNTIFTRTGFILLKKDTTYTFSLNGVKKSFHLYLYDLNKNFKEKIGMRNEYTPNVNCYIRLFQMDTIDKALYQVEEGTIATPYEPYQSNILTVNDVILRSNGSVYDELDLLTGKLTQRIDENGDVLSQEIVKTVDMNKLNKPYEGTNNYQLTSNIPCEAILEVPIVSTGEQTLEEINHY